MGTTCPSCGTRYGDNQRLCPRDGAVLDPDAAPEEAAVGRVLDGKYRLDAFLSRGGMGAVYAATHVMLNRKVAVKLINPALVNSQDTVRRFQREARAVTHLNHPNIVRVHDLGQTTDGSLYIAMDLIAGESLSAVIEAAGTLDPPRIVHILSQIVSALAHAHAHGIVHRDLKPQNIMIGRGPDSREVATLLDFGIAKTFEVDAHTKLTSTGFAVGTPHYMSPEQAGAGPVDARSDLYSLGVILYQMLTGVVPFDDASTPVILVKHLRETPVRPSMKRPNLAVSPNLERIAMRCLEKDPAKRFQSADELLKALAGHADLADATPTMPVAAPTRRAPRPPAAPAAIAPPAKSRTLSYVAIAVMVALVSGGLAALVSRRLTTTTAPPAVQTEPAPEQQAPPAQPAVAQDPPAQSAPAVAPPQPARPDRPQRPAVAAPTPAGASGGETAAADTGSTQPKADDPAPGREPNAARTPLSRALTARVRTLLTERGLGPRRFRAATLEMTMRPTRPGRGTTAEYVATVYTAAGERSFSGSQPGAAPGPLRNAVIEKLAAEIVAYLAATP